MKPKNFPARKNERRYQAILRLGAPGDPDTEATRQLIQDNTAARLNRDARSVRTKKVRGASR